MLSSGKRLAVSELAEGSCDGFRKLVPGIQLGEPS